MQSSISPCLGSLRSKKTRPSRTGGRVRRLLHRAENTLAIFLFMALCGTPAMAETAFVQVGSYQDDVYPQRLRDAVIAAGFDAAIERNGDLRRVVVGPFDNQQGALEAQRELASKGFEGFVRVGDLGVSAPPPSEAPAQAASATVQTNAPAAPPPGPMPAAGVAALDSYYFLQVGAYGPAELAQGRVSSLAELGYGAISVPSEDWNRVLVGPFRSKEEALAESAVLGEKGFDSFVRLGFPPMSRGASQDALSDLSQVTSPAPSPPERFRLRSETPLPPLEAALSPDGLPDIGHASAWSAQLPTTAGTGIPDSIPAPPAAETEPSLASAAPPPIIESPTLGKTTDRLRIEVLEGAGATNLIAQSSGHSPAVSVLDADGSPLGDAIVTYQTPDRGASGVFANGSRSVTMVTGPDGVARAVGFEPNEVPGEFEIRVTASHEGAQATERIVQTNVREARRTRTAAKILGSVGAGVAVWSLVRYLQGGGGDSQPSGPSTGVVGTASIGQPTAVEP